MEILALIAVAVGFVAFVRLAAPKKQPKSPVPQNTESALTLRYEISTPADVEADGDEFEERRPSFPVSARLEIIYRDAQGRKSSRRIDVIEVGNSGYGNTLEAYCFMRKSERSFRLSRIEQCTDLDTGEVIQDVYGYLRNLYEASPACAADSLVEAEYDALRVLLYMGKADGRFTAAERSIVYSALRNLAGNSGVDDLDLDRLFREIDPPSVQAFRLAVRRLESRPEHYRRALIEAAWKIIKTQKTAAEAEIYAFEYIQKHLSDASSPESA